MKKLVLAILILGGTLLAQAPQDVTALQNEVTVLRAELQQVKDGLIKETLDNQALVTEVQRLNGVINKVAQDLKQTKTVEQLDALKVAYGIEKEGTK